VSELERARKNIPNWSTGALRYLALEIMHELAKRQALPMYVDKLFFEVEALKRVIEK